MKKKQYLKPKVRKIKVDYKELVKAASGGIGCQPTSACPGPIHHYK